MNVSESDTPARATPETGCAPANKRPWVAPEITELPPLTQLTLLTGAGIPGSGAGGGTVF